MAGDIYTSAADVIDSALKKKGSLKHLCYSSKYKNKKKLFALVFETVKYKNLLEKVVNNTKLTWKSLEEEITLSLKLVLLYETVLGRGVHIHCKFHDTLHQHHDSIIDSFQSISQKHPGLVKESKRGELVLPRYVRVNTIKLPTEDVINIFIGEGYELVEWKQPKELSSSEFFIDEHIPDLLTFSCDTDFHAHPLYREGQILLQDKASCLPAFVLNPPPQSFVIDACAAPGNKSSHLASIISNEGSIYSFDLNKERFDVMNKLLLIAGASCVKTILKDFLKVRHDSPLFSNVEYILLDPSCSGSGMVSRLDELIDDNVSNLQQGSRLKGLSGFQTAALSHALSFPKVKKVVYSTCSIHKEENEDVVEKASKRFASTFSLLNILPEWKNRGIGDWEDALKCIRAVPENDHTNGFFVAVFERTSDVTPVAKQEDVEIISNVISEIKETNKNVKHNKILKTKKRKEMESSGGENVPSPFSIGSKKKKKRGGVKKAVTS